MVLRQGHLSDDALADAILLGTRPAHLDSCDICSQRALELGRWLEDVRTTAVEAADDAFPPERLAAQQAQILRRLEQLDEPARVLTFPAAAAAPRATTGRRVAPAWVGVAAAAGLVVGVIGGQMTARLDRTSVTSTPAQNIPQENAAQPAGSERTEFSSSHASLLELDLEGFTPEPLQGIDDITPRLIASSR